MRAHVHKHEIISFIQIGERFFFILPEKMKKQVSTRRRREKEDEKRLECHAHIHTHTHWEREIGFVCKGTENLRVSTSTNTLRTQNRTEKRKKTGAKDEKNAESWTTIIIKWNNVRWSRIREANTKTTCTAYIHNSYAYECIWWQGIECN